MTTEARGWDAIVIGSGIGGLAAAAALAKRDCRVLVLEQGVQLGGLTQVFRRRGYSFATGVHYVGGVGGAPGNEGQFGRLLDWLGDGRLRFASVGSPYDIVRLPGFEFPIEAPRAACVARLKAGFPDEAARIDAYFAACDRARGACMALFASRALPRPLALLVRAFNARRVRRALGTSTAQAVSAIRDRRLAAILTARWGNYGMLPADSPLAIHALVTGSYDSGAYYPVGGPASFAQALAPTISAAGGELRTRASVTDIRVQRADRGASHGRAVGVRLADGSCIDAPAVISAMGAHNTVAALPDDVAPAWRAAVGALRSGCSYVTLYLGLRGDIAELGATAANVWVYESDDFDRFWERPTETDPPALYVSFPSLKDAAHADPERHTAEVVALCPWQAFAPWAQSGSRERPAGYAAAKAAVTERLRASFARHFPRLAACIDHAELSTPLTQTAFVAADRGAMYGIATSAERLRQRTLDTRTPVPGLLLAGQDPVSPGVHGAFMGGFMAAASLQPRLWMELRR